MSLTDASMTMQAVCAAKLSDKRLCASDPLAQTICELLPKSQEYLQRFDSFSNGMFGKTVCFRKHYFSEIFAENSQQYEQLVLLCSGLEYSYLYQTAWGTKPCFFVDHPSSLELSSQVFALARGQVPDWVKFVPCDLSSCDGSHSFIEGLQKNGFDAKKATLILWEGASYYFNAETVKHLLANVASTIDNLRIVFDFVIDEGVAELDVAAEELEGLNESLEYIKEHSEPWKSKFSFEAIREQLLISGFQNIDLKHDIEIMREREDLIPDYHALFGYAQATK